MWTLSTQLQQVTRGSVITDTVSFVMDAEGISFHPQLIKFSCSCGLDNYIHADVLHWNSATKGTITSESFRCECGNTVTFTVTF